LGSASHFDVGRASVARDVTFERLVREVLFAMGWTPFQP
jgi:hypothetical protein